MRKILLLLPAILFLGRAAAQEKAFIDCRVDGKNTFKEIEINKVVDGRNVLMNKWEVDGTGSFTFGFIPEYEGFYSVSVSSDMYQYPLYIKAGDRVSFAINDERGVWLEGKNTPENQTLYRYEELSRDVRYNSVEFDRSGMIYDEYFPILIDFVPQKETFKQSVKTRNTRFNELMKAYADYSLDYYAINFLKTPRRDHPEKGDYPSYYATIEDPAKFESDVILSLPFGIRMMTSYPHINIDYSSEFPTISGDAKKFPNQRVKAEYVINSHLPLETYEDFTQLMEEFSPIMTPDQIRRMELKGAPLYQLREGVKAGDFTYPDMDGNMVSLSDFRGKVVLIDIWATWCGPCKQQIPYLKQLEEEMHGKDVVFLSVSIDEEKNYDKWKQMIADEGLGGVQLFANGWSQIVEIYEVKGIPRFIVVDRDGNLASSSSPRPSDPALKAMLEEQLNK